MSFLAQFWERNLSRKISARRLIDPREFSEDLCLRRSRRARVRVPPEADEFLENCKFSLPWGNCKFSLSPFLGEIDNNPRLNATIYFSPIFAENINTPRLRTSEWLGRKRGPLADAFLEKSGRQRSPWLAGVPFFAFWKGERENLQKRGREKICSKINILYSNAIHNDLKGDNTKCQ